MNYYRSLPEWTKDNIELSKTALQDRCHVQDRLCDMRIKMQGLKKGSSLEEYINDLDNLIRHVQLPEQQKICYFIFGLRFILKQVLLIPQSQSNQWRCSYICKTETSLYREQVWNWINGALARYTKGGWPKTYWHQVGTITCTGSRHTQYSTSTKHFPASNRHADTKSIWCSLGH